MECLDRWRHANGTGSSNYTHCNQCLFEYQLDTPFYIKYIKIINKLRMLWIFVLSCLGNAIIFNEYSKCKQENITRVIEKAEHNEKLSTYICVLNAIGYYYIIIWLPLILHELVYIWHSKIRITEIQYMGQSIVIIFKLFILFSILIFLVPVFAVVLLAHLQWCIIYDLLNKRYLCKIKVIDLNMGELV